MKGKSIVIIIIFSSLSCDTVAMQCDASDPTAIIICDSKPIPNEIPRSTRFLDIINGFNGTSLPQYFYRYSSLQEIRIEKCNIEIIQENTFVDLPVQYLSLMESEIETIQPGAFKNLAKLGFLSLASNKLKRIQAGSFTKLPLGILYLPHNSIETIEDSALSVLPNLQQLILDHNKIEKISISKILDDPSGLEILRLSNNSLKTLTNDMLRGMTNLTELHVEFNEIGTIEPGTFEETPNLYKLFLSYNQIKKLDGSIFPRDGLPYLEHIYLASNELMYLTSDFFVRLNYLKSISLVGNPWLCPCLDVILRILYDNETKEVCQGVYKNAGGPICISDPGKTKCSYQYNSELSAKYLEITKSIVNKEFVKKKLLCR